jgi:phosphoenolpyruvate synthase/pyruvate phosphate dikinase
MTPGTIASMKIILLNTAAPIDDVGGKAARLHDLMQLGATVPDGYVVVLASATDQLTADDVAALLDAFDELHVKHVAVRSSTSVEDSESASWAGQFDTYLFIDRKHLIEHIKRCFASTQSDRSVAYAASKDHTEHVRIAVIVQAMIPSDVSGVCFSVHPVTQQTDQIVIEAAFGLGEAVVSGEVTPDNYIISRSKRTIEQRSISHQTRALRFSTALQQTDWENVAEPDAQKLTDVQIIELADMAIRLEQHFGHPVDIEWAYYQGKLYLLQSRPITTLA